jgi:bifunctional DNA-binding transcriptional regulator/antitoxin component of YhaV-PrlF toxin-antitoxin module
MRALLDNAGRIRLPDLVQAQLGVKPGDELAFDEELGRWFIEPLIVLSQVRPFPTGARRGPKP